MIHTPKGWKRSEETFSEIAQAIQTQWDATGHGAMGRTAPPSKEWDFSRGWETSRDMFLRTGLIPKKETDDFQRQTHDMLNLLKLYRPVQSAIEYTRGETGDEVDVPEYLAGEDFNMIEYNATAPTRHYSIIMQGGVNGNVDASIYRNRGMLIQSLVEYLATDQHNSVDLLWISAALVSNGTRPELVKPNTVHVQTGDRLLTVVHVNTRPLDRDLCRYMFADVCFFRRVYSDCLEQKTGCGYWGNWREEALPKEAIPPNAIYFPLLQGGDPDYQTPAKALQKLKKICDTQVKAVMESAAAAIGGHV